jgi:hypothetical protein
MSNQVWWEPVKYKTQPGDEIKGRQSHSTVCYKGKIYMFGGCFAFNKKRHARENTNQLVEFDPDAKYMKIVQINGVSVGLRKDHTAVVYKNSMVVLGGTGEGGMMADDMLAYNFEDREWVKIKYNGCQVNLFSQGAACTVVPRKTKDMFLTRKVSFYKSDWITERPNSRRNLLLWRKTGAVQ